jgi:hypothetical protein
MQCELFNYKNSMDEETKISEQEIFYIISGNASYFD